MLFASTLLLALVGTAVAVPASLALERRHPALAVVESFHLEKRQSSTSQAISSLQDLLQKAVTSTTGNGQCSSECSGWISAVTKCTDLGSYTQIGICACGDDPLSAMNTCGNCYGSSSSQDASNFASFCRDNLSAISSLSSSIGGAATSRAASASSAVAGAGTASRTASGSSNATPTSAAGGSASAGGLGPQSSGSSQGSASQAPSSGAGTVRLGGLGVVAASLAGVAVVVMA